MSRTYQLTYAYINRCLKDCQTIFPFQLPPGVMEHFETATRDPTFFRLHKYLDDIFKTYKDNLGPYPRDEVGSRKAKKILKSSRAEIITQHLGIPLRSSSLE